MTALDSLAAANAGQAKFTAIKALRLDEGTTLVRIDTDAGISGYGECGSNDGDLVRAVIAGYAQGGRLRHLGLLGKDQLELRVHHHNMFYAYPQRRPHMQVLSGYRLPQGAPVCGRALVGVTKADHGHDPAASIRRGGGIDAWRCWPLAG